MHLFIDHLPFPSWYDDAHVPDHARLTHDIELFCYTKRDSRVWTPVGWGTVSSYREEDRMLVVTLPFCRPPARMWIHVEKVYGGCHHEKGTRLDRLRVKYQENGSECPFFNRFKILCCMSGSTVLKTVKVNF